MKEYTIVTTVDFTEIIQGDEEDKANCIDEFKDWLSMFNFDDKIIKSVKVFEREVEE